MNHTTMFEKVKSILLTAALGIHSAVSFLLLNLTMWMNHLWREGRWSNPLIKKGRSVSLQPERTSSAKDQPLAALSSNISR